MWGQWGLHVGKPRWAFPCGPDMGPTWVSPYGLAHQQPIWAQCGLACWAFPWPESINILCTHDLLVDLFLLLNHSLKSHFLHSSWILRLNWHSYQIKRSWSLWNSYNKGLLYLQWREYEFQLGNGLNRMSDVISCIIWYAGAPCWMF